jgi:hypothetical protein
LCHRLGASPAQANTMAVQMLKRVDQLVAQRGMTRPEALQYLLHLVIKGRGGETPSGFEGTIPPAA